MAAVLYVATGELFSLEPLPTFYSTQMSDYELLEFMEEREFIEYTVPVFVFESLVLILSLRLIYKIWTD